MVDSHIFAPTIIGVGDEKDKVFSPGERADKRALFVNEMAEMKVSDPKCEKKGAQQKNPTGNGWNVAGGRRDTRGKPQESPTTNKNDRIGSRTMSGRWLKSDTRCFKDEVMIGPGK